MSGLREDVHIDVASRMEVVDSVQSAAEVFAAGEGLETEAAHFLGVAVREAVVNAIRHGNRENPDLRVRIRLQADGGLLIFTVQDSGSGFEPNRVPDPVAPGNLDRGSGRGVFLMRKFADRVRVYFPSEGGSVVRLEKKISSAS